MPWNEIIQESGIQLPEGIKGKQIVEMIMDKHQPIAELFCSDSGLDLQNEDAQMTSAIIQECLENRVPVIPVHDSYIVPEQHRDFLQKLMVKVFKDRYGCTINVD